MSERIRLSPITANMTPNTASLTPITAGLTSDTVNLAVTAASMASTTANLAVSELSLNNSEFESPFESSEKSVVSHFDDIQTADAPEQVPGLPVLPSISKSIRIHLIIKRGDIGLEALHSELSALESDNLKIKHVKRVLNLIVLGHSVSGSSSSAKGAGHASLKSFPIIFRLSHRDSGLEKLHSELCSIEGASQRNHHVKRRLFDAYANTKQLSAVSTVTTPSLGLTPTVAPTATKSLDGPISPWASTERQVEPEALTPEQLAKRRVNQRKKTISGFN